MVKSMDYAGKTALITGASTGIGLAFAKDLAGKGANLVIAARSQDKLEQIAADLQAQHGVKVTVLPCDLSLPGASEKLAKSVEAQNITVDILINNAGFGTHGRFAEGDLARMSEEVQLNCVALTELTGLFLPGMLNRNVGVIINVASTAGFQAIPYMAVYGATKAYVLSFTEALWGETQSTGVKVLALCPGATETPFFEIAGSEDAAVGPRRTVDQVVKTAFTALERGKPSVVDGLRNAITARTTGFAPRRVVIGIAGKMVQPRSK
ncbi:MAG: SDR family NAD(P)-dependent oxidoreductase [Mycobacteriaceae bacterium]